jgi:hypothetical protein
MNDYAVLPLPDFPGIAQSSSPFQATRSQLRSKAFYFDIDLSVARSAASPLNLPICGNLFYVDQRPGTGIARIHFQDETPGSVPFTVFAGFVARLPFTQLGVENDAQPGATMRIIYGVDLDFAPGIGSGTFILNPSRAQWYDRNPLSKGFSYALDGVAPHGNTARWTYTVPAGRKALIEAATCEIMRQTAAAPVGLYYAEIIANLNDASFPRFINVISLDNTVGGRAGQSLNCATILQAGEIITGQTGDPSTAGTVAYRLTCKLTEFDA